jgi:hypothetical protein
VTAPFKGAQTKWSDFRVALSERLTQPLSSDFEIREDSEIKTAEEIFYMKKFSPLIALTLLAGCVALSPLKANAQDEKMVEFERVWYDTCYTKRDNEKCYLQSKELVEKYSKSTYRENATTRIKGYERNKALEKFQTALNAVFAPPQNAAKLDQLFAAGEEYLQLQPGQQFVIGQMARAGAFLAMGEVAYKNLDKVKGYAENALKAFEPAAPPEGWKKEEWEPLREIVLAQMNQFLGWQLIVPTKGDENLALDFLAKAIQVKGKDGIGWKDPYNYVLRSNVYNNQYIEARKPYDAMTDEQKVSDAGKEVLKKITDLLDTKLIPEWARVLATATSKETKPYADDVKPSFDSYWENRTGDKDKAADYIKNYADDPTIASVPIPAKPADASSLNTPAPTTGPGAVKLQSNAPGGKAPANGNGAKSAPTKGKTKPKSRRRGR